MYADRHDRDLAHFDFDDPTEVAPTTRPLPVGGDILDVMWQGQWVYLVAGEDSGKAAWCTEGEMGVRL